MNKNPFDVGEKYSHLEIEPEFEELLQQWIKESIAEDEELKRQASLLPPTPELNFEATEPIYKIDEDLFPLVAMKEDWGPPAEDPQQTVIHSSFQPQVTGSRQIDDGSLNVLTSPDTPRKSNPLVTEGTASGLSMVQRESSGLVSSDTHSRELRSATSNKSPGRDLLTTQHDAVNRGCIIQIDSDGDDDKHMNPKRAKLGEWRDVKRPEVNVQRNQTSAMAWRQCATAQTNTYATTGMPDMTKALPNQMQHFVRPAPSSAQSSVNPRASSNILANTHMRPQLNDPRLSAMLSVGTPLWQPQRVSHSQNSSRAGFSPGVSGQEICCLQCHSQMGRGRPYTLQHRQVRPNLSSGQALPTLNPRLLSASGQMGNGFQDHSRQNIPPVAYQQNWNARASSATSGPRMDGTMQQQVDPTSNFNQDVSTRASSSSSNADPFSYWFCQN